MSSRPVLFATAAALMVAGSALAQSDLSAVVKARNAHMDLYAFNLGPLVGMARGQIPYDAATAQAAAANLATLSALDQSRYWPEGSDSMSLAESRALPAIWDTPEDAIAKAVALSEAAAALAAAAGTDLASLQGALGPVGNACSACHEAYRAPEN